MWMQLAQKTRPPSPNLLSLDNIFLKCKQRDEEMRGSFLMATRGIHSFKWIRPCVYHTYPVRRCILGETVLLNDVFLYCCLCL